MSEENFGKSRKLIKDNNGLCSNSAVSVICYVRKDSQTSTDSKDESAHSDSAPENLSEILQSNQLIISRTSSVNLMTIPTNISTEMKRRIQGATLNPEQFSPHILLVAKLELAFLLAKDSVSSWADRIALENMINSGKESLCSAMTFTSVQVNFLVIEF